MAAFLGYWTGALIGGFVLTYLLSILVGKFAFKESEPEPRANGTIGIAAALVWLLSAWGYGNGGALVLSAGLPYIPGMLAAWLYKRKRLRETWTEDYEVFE